MNSRRIALVLMLAVLSSCRNPSDIVIYGGTSGGVAAAVEAARLGRSVVLIEPGRHLGGLSSGGLGATDIGNKRAIGGIAREFYKRIAAYYSRPESWRFEKRDDYVSGRRRDVDETTMWTFEPSVAEAIFENLVREHSIQVVRGERLDMNDGVHKDGARIVSIRMESGREFRGTVFIDASYEGDLLAEAGVSYHIGREANSVYGETLNGVQTKNAVHHQFKWPVDPYRVSGDPSSGLLPGVQDGPGEEGSGDARVQAYCFRMCLTDAAENRLPIRKPERYDPLRYELLLRSFDAGFDRVPWHNTAMPNRKTDINNNHGFSTDNIGLNYDYPDGTHEDREAIVIEHREYQIGLLWCLANDSRVPKSVRDEVRRWGLPKDEFADSGHWPGQLYIREARRMVGAYVMTQLNCQGLEIVEHPVGLAAYTMDSHNVQRYVRDGKAVNEGDVQFGGFPPYGIAYESLTPVESECSNLLAPVCLSASHIAFGSIRMEPVFMVLGQSAAAAASQAIEEGCSVQAVDYPRLRQTLLARGQVLEWTRESRPAN